jgi:hypothetical protein
MSFVRAAPRSRKAATPTPVNSHVEKAPIGEAADPLFAMDPLFISDDEDVDYEPPSSVADEDSGDEQWSLSE